MEKEKERYRTMSPYVSGYLSLNGFSYWLEHAHNNKFFFCFEDGPELQEAIRKFQLPQKINPQEFSDRVKEVKMKLYDALSSRGR